MAVHRDEEAFLSLRQRLGPPPPQEGSYVAPPVRDGPPMGSFVPRGFGVKRPAAWLWDEAVPVPPLRHPKAYRTGSTDDLLAQAPDIVSERRYSLAEREAYCRASADVTMKGGTTSGVVYYPSPAEIATEKVCEELWFTDGGVTSNFPIHFFDSPLPRWTTFGINLGSHPPGFNSQDVWLPQDWDTKHAPPRALEPSMTSFLAAVVDTARQWRDSEQTFMPGFRARIAWVRQRRDEGGTNPYMSNATIASLGLRGVVAGGLRRRFSAPEYWRRYQWVRLRSTLGKPGGARGRPAHQEGPDALPVPVEPREGVVLVLPIVTRELPRDPRRAGDVGEREPCFRPRHGSFWTSARRILAAVPQVPDGSLRSGVPEPASELRQVPPV